MSRATHSINLANTASIPPTYTVIHVRPGDQEWQITAIEMFADPAHTRLLDDDVLTKLDRNGHASIIRALNDWQLRHERGMRRLWNDITADAAVERIMNGAA